MFVDTLFLGLSASAGVNVATQNGSSVTLEYLFDFYPKQKAYDGTDVGAFPSWSIVDSRLSMHTIKLAVTF